MAITPEQLAWLNFVKVSSLPLRRIAANGMPDSVASGCIVNYRGRKFVLSVSHATGNGDNWAAELKHVQGCGTELSRFGNINFVTDHNIIDGSRTHVVTGKSVSGGDNSGGRRIV